MISLSCLYLPESRDDHVKWLLFSVPCIPASWTNLLLTLTGALLCETHLYLGNLWSGQRTVLPHTPFIPDLASLKPTEHKKNNIHSRATRLNVPDLCYVIELIVSSSLICLKIIFSMTHNFLTITAVDIDLHLSPLAPVLLLSTAFCGRKGTNRKPHKNLPAFIVVHLVPSITTFFWQWRIHRLLRVLVYFILDKIWIERKGRYKYFIVFRYCRWVSK